MVLTLTHFVLRVLLVNHEQAALATYNLAVGGTLLQRCSSLHIFFFLFVSKHDAALGEVVRAHLYLHLVAGEDLDVVHAHLAGDVGGDFVSVFQLYAEHGIAQRFHDDAVLFYCCLLGHRLTVLSFYFFDLFK